MGGDYCIMNEVIDQRTVEMRFDNKDFEKNIESTLESIAILKNNLNFQDSVHGVEILENAFKSLDLKNVKKSAQAASDSFSDLFSTFKNVYFIKEASRQFDNLRGVVGNTIQSMLQIKQMQSGWDKYTMKTKSVQTIMAATGKSIDEVSSALNKLNWYTDETSFDFADMVNNIGKFTSSGVDLKDAVTAMQGISNWAATSGQDVQQASRAMYNLSQALGVGSVKLQDWRSIELANMGTVEFKQTVLDTGVAIGKLTKESDKYYTKIGKKQEVSTKNFSSTLSTGWFDSELLIATLKRYSEFTDKVYAFMDEHPDEYDTVSKAMEAMRKEAEESGEEFDALGYKWFLAAQEAKSFEEAVNSIKDAVSTGWMRTFEYIFGNYEQARKLFTDLANELFPVFATPGEKRNEFLHETMVSSYSKLKEKIIEAGLSVEEFENHIVSSIEKNEENKKVLDSLISEYGSLSRAIELGVPSGKLLMEWISGAIDELSGKEITKTVHTLEEIQQIVNDTFAGKYDVGEERFTKYRELGYDAQAIQKLVNIFAKKGKVELEDLEAVGIEVGETYSETWKDFIDGNRDLIDSLDELSGRDLLISSLQNVLRNVFTGVTSVREGLESVFSLDPESFRGFLKKFYNLTDAFSLSEANAEKLKTMTANLVQPIKTVGNIGKKFIGAMLGNSFDNLIPKVKNASKNIFDTAYKASLRISRLFTSFENSAYVNKALSLFSKGIEEYTNFVSEKTKHYSHVISDLFSSAFVPSKVRKYVSEFKNIWGELYNGEQNVFDTLVKSLKEFKKRWVKSHGEDWNLFSALWDGIKNDYQRLRDKIKASGFGETLGKVFKKIFGEDKGWSDVESFFSNFIQKIQDGFKKFQPKLERVKAAFKAATEKFKTSFKSEGSTLFSDIKESVSTFWKTLKYGTKGKHSKADDFVEKVFGIDLSGSRIGKFVSNLREKISGIGETIRSLFQKESNKTKGIKGALGDNKDSSFIEDLAEGFRKRKELFRSWLEKIRDLIKTSSQTTEETIDLSGGGKNADTIEAFKNRLEKFWNWAKPLLQTMAETFAKSFNLQNLSQFITSLTGFNLAKILGNFKKVVETYKFDNVASTLRKDLESLVDAFSPLKDTKRELKARSVMEFAIAIGIVAGALYLIAGIDDKDLIKAGITIAAIAGALVGIGFLISKMGSTKFEIALSGAGQILKVIALILAMSIAIRNVGKAAKGIAEAVDLLVGAVGKFSDLAASKVKFQQGIEAVQNLILALGGASFMAGFLTFGNMFSGTALTILAFAAAIRILYNAVEDLTILATVSPEELEKSINSISKLLYMLGDASFLAGLTNSSWKNAAAAETILALSGAIKILQNSVMAFAAIPSSRLESAVDAMSKLIYMLGNASFWAGLSGGFLFGGIGKALTIMAFGKSIEIIVNAVEKIMTLSVDEKRFEVATGMIRTIITWLGVAAGAISLLNGASFKGFALGTGTFGIAVTILSFGVVIKLIGETIEGLGKLNQERLVRGGNAAGMIGLMLAGFTAVLGVVNRFLGLSVKELGSAAMIIAFGTAIKSIAETVIKLGELDNKKMQKGIDTTWHIVAMVSALTMVSSIANRISGGNTKFASANFLAMATGLLIIGQVIEKLGGVGDADLRKGGVFIAALGFVISACIAVMNMGAKVPSWTNAVNILALAGGIWILADAAKTFASFDGNQMKKAASGVVGLLSALTLISKWGLSSGNLGTLLNAASLFVIAGAVALFAEVAKTFADFEWDQMGRIGAAFGAMVVAVVAIGKVLKAGASISLGAAAGILKIIGIITAVLVALGALYKIEGVSNLMNSGGDFLGSIGRALGKFFGSIIGGFREGVADSMPAVGTAMAQFATNAEPFFKMLETYKDIDIVSALNGVANSLDKVIWADLFARVTKAISSTFGDDGEEIPIFKSLEAFGNGLGAFSTGFEQFLGTFDDKDTNKLTDVSGALKELSDISKDQQWIMENPLASDNPLLNFAKAINEAATEIEKAITALNALTPVNGNANAAIESLKEIGDIDTGEDFKLDINAPFFKAVLSWKEQSMTDFAQDLETSIGNITEFVTRANDIQFQSYGGKLKTTVLAEMLTALAEVNVPATGGIYTWWKDYSGSFTGFMGDIVKAMPDISSFISQVNNDTENIDMQKIDQIISIITKMAGIVMPVNDGTTFMTFEQLIGHYHGALAQISGLADEINTTYKDDLDTVHQLTDIFTPFTMSKEDLNLGALEDMPGRVKKFIDDLNKQLAGATIDENISNSILGLSELLKTDMKAIGFTEAAMDITSGLDKLSSVNQDNGANTLTPATETINTFTDVVKKLMRIQNDFNESRFSGNLEKMIEIINDSIGKLSAKARTNMDHVRDFFGSVQEIYSYEFEAGVPNKFGTLISALTEAIDMFSPNTKIEDLKAYTNWMEDLASKQDVFAQAGQAISSFAVDKDKLDSVTSFISALKGEFNFAPGDSVKKTNYDWEIGANDVYEKLPGYFSKIAQDLVSASEILSGKGTDEAPDFAAFDTLRMKLNNFAAAINRVVGSKPEELGESIRGFVVAINDAILGDSTEENPGIKDYGDRLSQFDALEPVFSQLESYQTSGLKDVVPDILTNITTAINDFSYDPNGIEVLKAAITGIKEALDILRDDTDTVSIGEFGDAKGSLSRSGSSKDHVSKTDKLVEKLSRYYDSDTSEMPGSNVFTSFADAINGLEINEQKANLLMNVAESLIDAANNAAEANPSALSGFVKVIADSIIQNADQTNEASETLIKDMLTVFENFMEKFFDVGVQIIKQISGGMEATPDAIEMAATIATRILARFSEASQTFGAEKGKELVSSIADGMNSDDSKDALSSALDMLFGIGEEGEPGGGFTEKLGNRIGSSFAQDFLDGFTTNLSTGEFDELSGMFQGITDFVSQLGSMDGDETADQFSTFMTDFANGITDLMKSDTVTEIQAACDELSSIIAGAVPDGYGLGYSFVEGIRDGLLEGIAEFGAEISSLAAQLGGLMNSGTANAIQSASPSKTAMRLGEYFVEGLKLGIEKNVSSAYGAGQSVGNAAVNGTKNTLGIHSPSKVLYNIGEFAVDGFTKGIEDSAGSAANAMEDMANLSVDEAMDLIKLLESSNYPIYSKGRVWQKSDIGFLKQYIASIQNAATATEDYSKKVESSADNIEEAQHGVSGEANNGGKDETSNKKSSNVLTADVKGTETPVYQIGEILKGLIANGGSYELNGIKYGWSDIPKEFVSMYKDYFSNVFGNTDGFIEGLETFLGSDSLNVKGTTAVENEIDHLSSVFEMGSGKVGLTKEAVFSIGERQSSIISPIINKIIDQTSRSMNQETTRSVKSGTSEGTSSGGNTYNFNQQIVGSKAASRAEIYRQTKNQFSQLKSIDSKTQPYTVIAA